MTDELPLRVEAEELAGSEQLRVTDAGEIRVLLQRVAEHHEFTCLYVDASDRFALSSVLGLNGEQLILDMPNHPMRSEVLSVDKLFCVSSLQRVKLQFEVRTPRIVDWNGQAAIGTSLPDHVLRLQRRDFYRLTVPLGQPLSCFIPSGHGDEVEISLVDISVGGVGILGFVPGLRLTPGAHFHGVRIELPGTGTVMCDMEIRSSFDVTLRNGIRTVRIGGQFVNPNSATQSLVQRYITRIERERISRGGGDQ